MGKLSRNAQNILIIALRYNHVQMHVLFKMRACMMFISLYPHKLACPLLYSSLQESHHHCKRNALYVYTPTPTFTKWWVLTLFPCVFMLGSVLALGGKMKSYCCHGRCRLVHADDCENTQRAHTGASEEFRYRSVKHWQTGQKPVIILLWCAFDSLCLLMSWLIYLSTSCLFKVTRLTWWC